MTPTPVYLRAADEAEMLAALQLAWLTKTDENGDEQPILTNVVMVGAMYKPTGQTITHPDGIEYPEMAAVPGYHANVLASDQATIDILAPVTTTPTTPQYTWAEG